MEAVFYSSNLLGCPTMSLIPVRSAAEVTVHRWENLGRLDNKHKASVSSVAGEKSLVWDQISLM